MKTALISASPPSRDNDGYEDFLTSVREAFAAQTGKLFTTDAVGLWDAFIGGLPADARQHYTCHACRHFIERYGGLVRIDEDGVRYPALWSSDSTPKFFRRSVLDMQNVIARSRITGVFVSERTVYGEPVTGEWRHLSVIAPEGGVWNSRAQTADQRAAELREDFKMLVDALRTYKPATVDQALKLLRSDSLYRSEKVRGVAEWLRTIQEKHAAHKSSSAKANILWLAVACAPAGFCHIKSSMIGTLLEDIADGMTFPVTKRRFDAKMEPTLYQRPQAAPTAGNIAQAEKTIAQLQSAGALERRFARLDEIQTIWRPTEKKAEARDGVFAHLTPKSGAPQTADMQTPPVKMTWEKFARTVLPDALEIEFNPGSRKENYCAITTATNHDAPPILQWDRPEARNPFSAYVYSRGSFPRDWNLTKPGYSKVTAICLSPSAWQAGFEHQGKQVIFILEGAKDTRYKTSGNALFPEVLKAEYRAIRATIEAYSKSAVLGGYEEASACGVTRFASHAFDWNLTLLVTSSTGKQAYTLDRWD